MGKQSQLYRALRLRHGNVRLDANVLDRPDLRVGNTVTLKEDPENREWGIEWVSQHVRERYLLNRTWNNNI